MLQPVKDVKDYKKLWEDLKELTTGHPLAEPDAISIYLDELRDFMLKMEKEQEKTFTCRNCERYSLKSPDGLAFRHYCDEAEISRNFLNKINYVPDDCPGWIERKNKVIVVEKVGYDS